MPGSALNRILLEAPFLPRCSDDKTATRIRPREYAVRYPYMQVNRAGYVSWLIFDIDHTNPAIWLDVGLPAPNLTVINRSSGKSHLYYAIPPVCTSENARAKPIRFMKAVYAAFAIKLQADLRFHNGPVAKTPGHPWWLTDELHNHTYELGQLADYVDLEVANPWAKTKDVDETRHSRHCLLFDALRRYAYSIVARERTAGNYEHFFRLLDAYAHSSNSFQKLGFQADLAQSSLRSTVRSVARWTWDRYRGTSACHRGVMQLDHNLSIPQRQQLAAARTHMVRRQGTESKIRRALQTLITAKKQITQAAISAATGLSRQTIAKYKHLLSVPTTASLTPIVKQAAVTNLSVNFAVHQVPTPSFKGGRQSSALRLCDVGYVSDG